ncbi:MAG TPA: peptide-methionine (S)-S-oxide reductase, partial [bacterium]|nr:peptide-methionine (S)-S-oxide reductase [bacterium]
MRKEPMITNQAAVDTATFGAGCFWCVEAVFQRTKGVLSVKSGYSG